MGGRVEGGKKGATRERGRGRGYVSTGSVRCTGRVRAG